MKAVEIHSNDNHILYDAALLENPGADCFEPAHWRARGALQGAAEGRGAAVFIHAGKQDYVLRHYRRGGMAARLSADCYLWTGLARSRAWREWHLLAELAGRGLPVPRPVAARVQRAGLCYRADILLLRIPAARPLAEMLMEEALPEAGWQALGALLQRFHAAGVFHADLNARNILRDAGGGFHLIDFDRGRLRPPQANWQQANLARLRRSLDKFARRGQGFHFSGKDWQALLRGYAGKTAG